MENIMPYIIKFSLLISLMLIPGVASEYKNKSYVCYDTKSFNDQNKVNYQGCIRSNVPCKRNNKMHFGRYPNNTKTIEAFKRCQNSTPRFIDSGRTGGNSYSQKSAKKEKVIGKKSSSQVSTYASEAERNKSYANQCKVKASQYDISSDPQSGSICSTAIYHKCVADKLCPHYPNKCSALNSRVTTTCKILSGMGSSCKACN